MNTLELIYQDIVQSVGYRTTVGPIDKRKVERRRAGIATPLPSARLARAAWRVAALLAPVSPPPPPPPPPYKRVAPRVAYKAGNSDARYCVKDFPGLRDEVAAYDENGLCTDGRRSDGSPADCPTSALEIDGREYCSLPTVGDPTKNTGSWLI